MKKVAFFLISLFTLSLATIKAVPTDIIPSAIATYVRANYPDAVVVKIERDKKEYEVELSNKVELTFDQKFNLRDIDM